MSASTISKVHVYNEHFDRRAIFLVIVLNHQKMCDVTSKIIFIALFLPGDLSSHAAPRVNFDRLIFRSRPLDSASRRSSVHILLISRCRSLSLEHFS